MMSDTGLKITIDAPNGKIDMPTLEECGDLREPFVFAIGQLEMLGLEAFVSSGTLLGLFRDGDFIPDDSDIDIDIITTTGEGIALVEELTEAYKETDWKLVRTQTLEYGQHNIPMQIAFQTESGLIIDHYIFYTDVVVGQENEGKGLQCNINEHGIMQYPYFDITWQHNDKYGFMPCPHPMVDYFKVRYGDDWMTPQDNKGIFRSEDTAHANITVEKEDGDDT